MMSKYPLIKRLLAFIYEGLILLAIWMLLTYIFITIFGDATTGSMRLSLQAFLWVVTGLYFTYCWTKKGQTPALAAWKLKVFNSNNQLLSYSQAWLRYIAATIGLVLLGVTFLWALFDKDNLSLHDRLLNNKVVFDTLN